MNGRVELGLTVRRSDPSFAGRYAKVVNTKTDEMIFVLIRHPTRVKPFKSQKEPIMSRFDLFFHGVYTVWTMDDREAELVIAFDLVPVVHVEDLAAIAIGKCQDFMPEGTFWYLEYEEQD